MKLILFLNKDIQANLAYTLLKPELIKHDVQIYYTDAVGDPQKKPQELQAFENFEKAFIYDDLKAYLKQQNWTTDFEFLDEDFTSFPIEKAKKVNDPGFIAKVKAFSPDLFISIRFGKIFKEEIIQVPKHGLINLHSGILPDYKGILASLHAIKAGEKEIGCTLHSIPDSGIDTGDILNIARLKVRPEKSLFWHVNQLYPLGVELIIQALRDLSQGKKLPKKKQDLKKGQYFSVASAADFRQLESLGIASFSSNDYAAFIAKHIGKNFTEVQQKQLQAWLQQKLDTMRV